MSWEPGRTAESRGIPFEGQRESPSRSPVTTDGLRFNLASVDCEWRTENTAWETQLALRPTQLDQVQLKVLPTPTLGGASAQSGGERLAGWLQQV